MVTLTPHGLRINGEVVPVYSGTIHYWRLERDRWHKILTQAKGLGFNMIETYIPWSVHETAPGVFDWGAVDARKDFEAFMRLCEELGLWLIARPGPLINAELTDFGFPEWVLMDPAVQARTALDTIHFDAAWGLHPPHQFPVPSYASEKFFALAAGWFDAVCPLLARHLAPTGCVVAVQSDNETCYLFHDQPYATDYSADSLKLYRQFLADRYGTLEDLNAAYHSTFADFAAVEPPRDCELRSRTEMAWHVDWVAYKEFQITWSVARFARMLRERGLGGVPIFHDVAFQYQTPADIVNMEADPEIDWVGMNLYRNKEDYAGGMKRIRYLAGSTRLPFVPELGCGLWSHHPLTFTPDEHAFITLGALMHGLKAFNLYMLAERDRWQGSAITRHGELRADRAVFYQRLNAFLHRYKFWEFEKQRHLIVLFNYDAGRLAALTTTLHYAHVDLLGLPPQLSEVEVDLGLRWDARRESELRPDSWLGAVTAWLNQQHLDYDFGDTHLSAAQLGRYAVVCAPMVDFLEPRAQEQLLEYVRGGGHLILGPGLPTLDPALKPYSVLARHITQPGTVAVGAGTLTWAATAEVGEALAALNLQPEVMCDLPEIELTLHRRGEQKLLFAANPTAHALTAQLRLRQPGHLQPAWEGTLPPTDSLVITLPAYSVNVWEVRHD